MSIQDSLLFDDNGPSLDTVSGAWAQVCQQVSEELGNSTFARYVEPLKIISYDGKTVTLGATGAFIRDWVKEKYLSKLQGMLCEQVGEPVQLQVVVLERKAKVKELSSQVTAVVQKAVPDEHGFVPNPRYTFDTYVVGDSNRLAVAGAKRVAFNPGTDLNPLFIYGASGLGKTHLLHAIASAAKASDPKLNVRYVTAQLFAQEFVKSLQAGKTESFRRSHRAIDMWLVDDIQFIAGKDKTSEEVFHTFNFLHSMRKQIVLCSDRSPRDLYSMNERLKTRFECGLVADVQLPDTETRCAIVMRKAEMDQLVIDPEIAFYLAENVPGNIRILEGALTKLATIASVYSREIDMDLAQEVIEKYYQLDKMAKPSLNQVVDVVSQHFKIDSPAIKGESRKAPIVLARHVAIYLFRELTNDSWKHIGHIFGNRDHTSMMHGYQRVSEQANNDPEFQKVLKLLYRRLAPSETDRLKH